MTLLGVRYPAGTPVRLDNVKPALRRRLIEMRRVVPHVAESAADVQRIGGLPAALTERCSEIAGSTGTQCRRDAVEAGICAIHRRARDRRNASNESSEG